MHMKPFILLAMLLGSTPAIHAQTTVSKAPTTLDGWASRAERFGKSIPQEQVFVHMDNNCYFLGDTIYYKAYVMRSDTRKPSLVSGVLYADLYNQDGYLVERQQLEVKGGQCYGSFLLPDTLYSGYYELRAYTRWMLNWGITDHDHTKLAEQWFMTRAYARDYYIDYDKLYSRTFPVYDRPKTEGAYEHNMTLRPLRKRVAGTGDANDLTLALYPEGGDLVAGVPCRVAWEGDTDEGLHQEGTLVVTDQNGQQVATSKTESRGRGTFTFTPQTGSTYTATLKAGTQEAKARLPKPQADGCALQVQQDGSQVTITLACAGQASQVPLGVTVMCQGVQQDFRQLEAGKQQTLSMKADALATGVNQVTVFDAAGRVWADRLFFVRNASMPLANTLTFTGLSKQGAEPYAPVDVQIKGGVPGSTVSMAVRDAEHTEYLYDDANIMTEMLLGSQVKGLVENPRYFFEKDDDEHQRALDLLLLVQGWRRFDWHSMATPGAFELLHQPERTPYMTGTVNRYEAMAQDNELDAQVAEARDKAMMTDGEKEAQAPDKSHRVSVAEQANGDKIKDVAQEMSVFAEESERLQRTNNATQAQNVHGRYWSAPRGPKRDVLVHAEFVKGDPASGVTGDVATKGARFGIQSPRFFEGCQFFLAASDTTKWNDAQRKNFLWVNTGEDEKERLNYPEFYVKLDQYNPRFVKPYSWYQTHLAEAPKGSAINEDWLYDDARALHTVTVQAKRNSYTRFDASKPAFVVDAYDAFNAVADAGLQHAVYTSYQQFAENVARYYVGDMNQERNYELEIRFNSKKASNNLTQKEMDLYNHLTMLDKVYIYTDYSPRQEGSKKYQGSNQPLVIVDLRRFDDDMKRTTYRDRFYQLPGYSLCYEYYRPSYATKPLPEHKDYRRTLYWDPNVQLDESGQAHIQFYNNGKHTLMGISAEGMASDGTLQSGLEMPEDRK